MTIEIKTQKELDAALTKGERDFRFVARGEFSITCLNRVTVAVSAELMWGVLVKFFESSSAVLRGSSRAELWGSSSAELWGSSSAVLWGSSSAVLRGSSSAELWGSSRAELRESSSAVLRGSSSADAKGFSSLHLWNLAKATLSVKCHVHLHSRKAKATGGIQTEAYIETAKEWCEYYGVEIKRGVAVLYKAVRDDFGSWRDPDFKYIPGTKPFVTEMDSSECSTGLHFCPHPRMANDFNRSNKFVACPVKINEIMFNMDWGSPQKVKAKRVYQACYEVTIDGEKAAA